nr:MAG TPA: putative tRNA modification GTPase [Caudoviricetes sp.]DAQ02485.1 MAG TPA: putative tRNA modification GTPase [Caudoviricetes sp.]
MIRHHKYSDSFPKGIHWGSSPQREQNKDNK